MAKKKPDAAPFDPEEDLLPEDGGGQEAAELEAATRGVEVASIPTIPVAEPLPEPAVMTGIAVKRAVPVLFVVATEAGEIETDEGRMAYEAGWYILTDHTGDGRRWPVDPAYFERHYVLGEKQPDWTEVKAALESGYESRNPNFTAGGTAYVRVFCPECDQPMFFSVDTDAQLTIKGDERKLKPTFKATAKVHTCHQTVASDTAFLEDAPAADAALTETVLAATTPSCPCTECDPSCDNDAGVSDGADGPVPSVCVPCANGDHVAPEEDDDADAD